MSQQKDPKTATDSGVGVDAIVRRFVAFSGGVDSTALALICSDAQPVFTDTGWEFPELYAHIDKFEKVTKRKVIRLKSKYISLPDYIRNQKFFPGHGARFCTRLFKIEPYNEFIKTHLPAELLIGLRADEPERIGNITELEGLKIRYPLREKGFNRINCLKICADAQLLPRFPLYMARGGCIGCFYKRKSEVSAIVNLLPEVAEDLKKLEKEVQDQRGKFALMFPNTGKSIAAIQAQGELFNADEVYTAAQQNDDVGLECGLLCNR